jgi:hypothetical protein
MSARRISAVRSVVCSSGERNSARPAEEQPSIGRDAVVMEEVLRIEGDAVLRQKSRRRAWLEGLGRDDETADWNQPPLQPGRDACRVAVRGDQHIARFHGRGAGAHEVQPPPGRNPIDGGDRGMRHNRRAAACRRTGQPFDVPGGIQRRALFVDQEAMVGVRADLGSLIRPRHDLHAMVEHPCEQRLLVLQRLEVFRLRRRLNVSRAGVPAVDRFFGDDRFEPRHRLAGDVEELPRRHLAKTIDQRGRIELETGEHLTPVARARAGADTVAFEHQYGRTGPGEMTCRRQAGVAGADDGDVNAIWKINRGQGLGVSCWRISNRVPPVRVILHTRDAGNTMTRTEVF